MNIGIFRQFMVSRFPHASTHTKTATANACCFTKDNLKRNISKIRTELIGGSTKRFPQLAQKDGELEVSEIIAAI